LYKTDESALHYSIAL